MLTPYLPCPARNKGAHGLGSASGRSCFPDPPPRSHRARRHPVGTVTRGTGSGATCGELGACAGGAESHCPIAAEPQPNEQRAVRSTGCAQVVSIARRGRETNFL